MNDNFVMSVVLILLRFNLTDSFAFFSENCRPGKASTNTDIPTSVNLRFQGNTYNELES